MKDMDIQNLEMQVNKLTREGKMIESIDAYFADDCVFEEPDGTKRNSRKAERDHLTKFFSTLKSFDGATLHAHSVGDKVSMSEWTFKMTSGEGKPIVWNEVLVRNWDNGKVVSEKYYAA